MLAASATFVLLSPAFAQSERMGEFRFSEFSLSPRLAIQEPGKSNFELKETWLDTQWVLDSNISGQIGFGTSDMVASAIWFTPKTGDFALTKAYVEGHSSFFDVRAGLLPIPQGYEGTYPEWDWHLPSSRVRRQNWFAKRDFGMQIFVQNRPYQTSLTVHNGESGTNMDGKLWYTGMWMVADPIGFGALATASVGNTQPASTSGSKAASEHQFEFDVSDNAKIRYGSLSLFRRWPRSVFLLEGGQGDLIQSDRKRPFAWGRVDTSINFGGDVNLLLRYEQTQSNLKQTETIIKSSSAGFSFASQDRLSSLTLFVTRNKEDTEVMNDEYFLIFKLGSNRLNFQ